MSVCVFGAGELANVAAAIHHRSRSWGTDHLTHMISALARVSEANVACYNDNRGSKARPSTVREITDAVDALGGCSNADLAAAYRVVNLLHYNCDDVGGDFTLKVDGAHDALIFVLRGMMDALASKAGIE